MAPQVLFPEAVATMLSAVHRQLAAAGAPRHRLAALQPLRALLVLLGNRVCEIATLRYALHIVMLVMDIR